METVTDVPCIDFFLQFESTIDTQERMLEMIFLYRDMIIVNILVLIFIQRLIFFVSFTIRATKIG